MVRLENKQRSSVGFETALKNCILDSFVDYGYSISSKGFLPAVVDIMVIWVKFTLSSSLLLYRNTIDFWILILYTATLLNSFLSLSVLQWSFLGFLYIVPYHLPIVSCFSFLFTFNAFLFFFLIWLLWLGLPILC